MWRKHRPAFQDHVRYIHNDTVKHLMVSIIQYSERVCKMHEMDNYLPHYSNKGDIYDQDNWRFRNRGFTEYKIYIVNNYVIPTSIQDYMDEKDTDFNSLPH